MCDHLISPLSVYKHEEGGRESSAKQGSLKQYLCFREPATAGYITSHFLSIVFQDKQQDM